MSEKLRNKKGSQRSELFAMASRDPWMVWRLKAMEAGYVPPLLPGQVPPEMLRATLGMLDDGYQAKPLVDHAKQFENRQRKSIQKLFTLVLTGFILLATLGFVYAINTESNFSIGFVEALIQQR